MFIRKINSRIKIVLVIFILLFVIIVLRVMYIELFEYKKLSTLANDLWSRDLPIEGDRGLILDRNGVVIADNITTTSLVLIPNQIKNKDEVSEKLADILGISKKEMDKHVKKNTSIERVHPEGRRLSYDIDALVCGTVNYYIWIMKYDLYDLILSNRRMDLTSPYIACMTIGPKKEI